MKINKERVLELTEKVTADYEKMMSAVSLCPEENYKSYIKLLCFIAPLVSGRTPENRKALFAGNEAFIPVCYALLSETGCFPEEQLLSYTKLGSFLQTVPDIRCVPGLDAPCINGEGEFILASAFAQESSTCNNKSTVFCVVKDLDDLERITAEAERTKASGLSGLTLIIVCSTPEYDGKYDSELVPELESSGWKCFKASSCEYDSIEGVFAERLSCAAPALIQINIF